MFTTLMDRETAQQARWRALAGEPTPTPLPDWITAQGLAPLSPWPAAPPSLAWRAETLADSTDIMLQELESALEKQQVIESPLWPVPVYFGRDCFPWVYALIGERDLAGGVRRQLRMGRQSPLSVQVLDLLRTPHPHTIPELRQAVGGGKTSELAIADALHKLQSAAWVLRLGRREGQSLWQATSSAWPELPPLALTYSKASAAANFILHYLDCMLIATEPELTEFFRPLIPVSRLQSGLRALASGGYLRPTNMAGTPAWELTDSESPAHMTEHADPSLPSDRSR